MPSTNLQVNFRVSEAEMAAIEAAKPPGMTLGAFAKAATLFAVDMAGNPVVSVRTVPGMVSGTDPGLEVAATTHTPPKKTPRASNSQPSPRFGVCKAHGAVLMAGRDRCSRYDCKG